MANGNVLNGSNTPEPRPEWGDQLVAAISKCLQGNVASAGAFEVTAKLLKHLDQKLGSKMFELSEAFLSRWPIRPPDEGDFAQYLVDKWSYPRPPAPTNDPRSVIAAVVIFCAPHFTNDQKRLLIKLAARDNLRASINTMLMQTDPELNATIGAGLVRGLLFNVICAHTLSTGLPNCYRGVFPVLSALIEYQAGMLADGFKKLKNRRSGLEEHPCALIPKMVKELGHHQIGTGTLFDEIDRIAQHWQHFATGLAAETPGELLDKELIDVIRDPQPSAARSDSSLAPESKLIFPGRFDDNGISNTVEAEWRAALGRLPPALRKQIVGWPNSFMLLTQKYSWRYPVEVAHKLATQNVVEFSIGGVDPSDLPSYFENDENKQLLLKVLGPHPRIVPSSVLNLNTADGPDLKDILKLLDKFRTRQKSDAQIKQEIPVCSPSLSIENQRVGSARFFSVLGFLKDLYSGSQSVSLVADHELPFFLERVAENGFLFRPEPPNSTQTRNKVILERDAIADPSDILSKLLIIWKEDDTLVGKIPRELALRIFTEIIAPRLAQTENGDVLQPFRSGSKLVGWKEHSVLKRFNALQLLRPEDAPEPREEGHNTQTTLYVLEIPPSSSGQETSPFNSETLMFNH